MPYGSLRTAALLSAAVVAAVPATTRPAAAAEVYGPAVPYTKILHGQFTFVPLPNAAMINRTRYGYVYKAGQQDSDLVVTQVDEGLRFHDRGTLRFKSLPGSCERQVVRVGVAAVCAVPEGVSSDNHLLLEVWPRLGDDSVDASALSAVIDVTVLADAGADVVRTGAGNDFVNGAFQADWVSGGAGNDWIRTGDGDVTVSGDEGSDYLVGSGDRDAMQGGSGDDRVYGGAGADAVWADAGHDIASCGGQSDRAYVDDLDRTRDCESVFQE